MSWLKEIESFLAKQLAKQKEEDEAKKRAEQLAKEREERERIERIKVWEESQAGQLLKNLLTRWNEWKIDKIITEIRDLLWSHSEISKLKVVLNEKGKCVQVLKISPEEEKIGIFEEIEKLGINPEEVENIYIKREILHGQWMDIIPSRSNPEGGYERVGDEVDFSVLLNERHLDEFPTVEGFKEAIIRELKNTLAKPN